MLRSRFRKPLHNKLKKFNSPSTRTKRPLESNTQSITTSPPKKPLYNSTNTSSTPINSNTTHNASVSNLPPKSKSVPQSPNISMISKSKPFTVPKARGINNSLHSVSKSNLTQKTQSSGTTSHIDSKRYPKTSLKTISSLGSSGDSTDSKPKKSGKISLITRTKAFAEKKQQFADCPSGGIPPPSYWTCVYGKFKPGKKKKLFPHDGILTVTAKGASLYKMSGKLFREQPLSKSELVMLPNQFLLMGSWEVELISNFSESKWHSGSIFVTGNVDNSMTVVIPKPQNTNRRLSQQGSQSTLKPRHDPDLPSSYVLYRPEWNITKKKTVSVVVDPRLATLLHPYQLLGVEFMWNCITWGLQKKVSTPKLLRIRKSHVSEHVVSGDICDGFGCILADDMGLGKTLTTLTLIWTALNQSPFGGALCRAAIILTPTSLVKNWASEIKKWFGDQRLIPTIVQGSKNKIKKILQDWFSSKSSIMIISYEQYRINSSFLCKHDNFDLIVCDEAHRIKNTGIKLTQVMNQLRSPRRVLLTGTPIQNNLNEFYSMMNFVNPGFFGSVDQFNQLYLNPIKKASLDTAKEKDIHLAQVRENMLKTMTQICLLRRTNAVIAQHLPPRHIHAVFCEMTPLQTKLYRSILQGKVAKRIIRHARNQLSDLARKRTVSNNSREDTTSDALVCMNQLQKVCNHPDLPFSHFGRDIDTIIEESNWGTPDTDWNLIFHSDFIKNSSYYGWSGKFLVLRSLLQELDTNHPFDKIIIVSNWTSTLDRIENLLLTLNLSFSRLDGSTKQQDRFDLVTHFNTCAPAVQKIFLLSAKAGGEGLNITGANRMVLMDLNFNPAVDEQAMARCWRPGQVNEVTIYRLVSTGSIEEIIFQRQIVKKSMQKSIFKSNVFSSQAGFHPSEVCDLFSLDTISLSNTYEKMSQKSVKELYKEWKTDQLPKELSNLHVSKRLVLTDETSSDGTGHSPMPPRITFCLSTLITAEKTKLIAKNQLAQYESLSSADDDDEEEDIKI